MLGFDGCLRCWGVAPAQAGLYVCQTTRFSYGLCGHSFRMGDATQWGVADPVLRSFSSLDTEYSFLVSIHGNALEAVAYARESAELEGPAPGTKAASTAPQEGEAGAAEDDDTATGEGGGGEGGEGEGENRRGRRHEGASGGNAGSGPQRLTRSALLKPHPLSVSIEFGMSVLRGCSGISVSFRPGTMLFVRCYLLIVRAVFDATPDCLHDVPGYLRLVALARGPLFI